MPQWQRPLLFQHTNGYAHFLNVYNNALRESPVTQRGVDWQLV